MKEKTDRSQEKERKKQEKIAAKEDKAKIKREKKKNRSRKGLVAFLVLFLLLLGGVLAMVGYDYQQQKAAVVHKNVVFMGENLGGLTKEEGRAKIEEAAQKIGGREITLQYNDSAWPYTASQLGLMVDEDAIFQKVYAVGHSGNIISRYKDRIYCYNKEKTITYEPQIDAKVLEPILNTIGEELGVNAEDAYFALDENSDIHIVPSKDGVMLDYEKTEDAIIVALDDVNATAVDLVVNINAQPEVTTADLEAKKINGILATFSTKYNAGEVDRSHNLLQSCKYLDMKLVDSGDTFSFNSTVGERTTARGFRNAIIIENGQYTPGMGGGVCQVSTTLYGALLRTAHLNVTDRQHHSLASSYVEPGQDAMVAWGSSDLCFTNEYSSAILIHAVSGGGTITMTIYGDTAYKQEVKLISDVVRYLPYTTETVVDNDMAPGTEKVTSSGKRGLECYLYKKVYENGVEISSETVNHDTYRPQKRMISVGP